MKQLITNEQLLALAAYARENGRTWKAKLNTEWMYGTASGPLMCVRNQFGPTWLARFNFKNYIVTIHFPN